MEDLLRVYKKELFERISLKKTLNKTDEQILLDNFKYFDLNGNNYSTLQDFLRTNERIGIKMRKKEDLIKIFNFFDKNSSKVINYRIFTKKILGLNNSKNIDDNVNNLVKNNNFIIEDNDSKIGGNNQNSRKNGYLKRNMESYDNIIFNYNNKNKIKNNNIVHKYRNNGEEYENENKNQNYMENNVNKKRPIIEQPFFEKIINFLLQNNKY